MAARFRRTRGFGLAALLLWACSVAAAVGDVQVLTSPEHSQQAMDRAFVQAAFTMRGRRWPDGAPLRVFVLPDDHPVHVQFTRDHLGTFPYVLRNIWDRLVYTGTGFAPTVVRTEEEMREKVRATPGAIGYARAATPPKGAAP